MQHHLVPTRLLDWSSVLGVAIYFALLGYEADSGRTPCVWLLNPYALNDATWQVPRLFSPKYLARDEAHNRSFEFGELLLGSRPSQPEWQPWQTPIAIYEHQKSDRMFAQAGWFTIHGTDRRPIEEIFTGRDHILQKVEIPPGAVVGLRSFLSYSGIGARQLFPGLDGLARSVREKFGIM
jgi:hypothetical protein